MFVRNGFTLIELTVVILILGIVGFVINLDFSGYSVELRAQAEQLASDIRYTQQIAMARNARYRINFFSSSYTITDRAGTTSVPHPGTNSASVSLQGQVTLTVNAALPNSFVVFSSKGTPYTDSSMPGTALSSTGIITLTRDSETQTIQIVPETGQVVMGAGT